MSVPHYYETVSQDDLASETPMDQQSLLPSATKEIEVLPQYQFYDTALSYRKRFALLWSLPCLCLTISLILSMIAIASLCLNISPWEAISDQRWIRHHKNPYRFSRFRGQDDLLAFQKPGDKKIIGLVFAGRYKNTHILNAYLERNLVRNGGWLDEIIWNIRTSNQNDTNYIESLVNSTANYRALRGAKTYGDAYKVAERGNIYVKIDDDIVFMEDHTIPALVKRLVENPHYLAVSANVVNQPAIAWIHHHLGAVHPYLPELNNSIGDKTDTLSSTDSASLPLPPVHGWRASALPYWQGPSNFTIRLDAHAPYNGHRWLPLQSPSDLDRTPIHALGNRREYHAFALGWNRWPIAAQEHYSFLQNLEKNELWRYKFDMWDFRYERLSINFIAFMGDTVIDNPVPRDDERYLTCILSPKLHRPVVLDGTAVAVHFSFGRQNFDLQKTDLLSRYEAFANEFVRGKRIGSAMP